MSFRESRISNQNPEQAKMSPVREALHTQLRAVIESCLAAELDLPGGLVYSAETTMRPGKVYVMGLNPGGNPDKDPFSIRDSLAQLPNQTGNDYADSWSDRPAGQAPLQRRIRYLVENVLGAQLEETFATNLIFRKTKSARSLNLSIDGDRCWPVHEAFLRIVQPDVILAFGNSGVSPYGYLLGRSRAAGGMLEEETSESSGHGSWRLRTFTAVLAGRPTRIVGFPHLSRYDPTRKPHVVDWLQRLTFPKG